MFTFPIPQLFSLLFLLSRSLYFTWKIVTWFQDYKKFWENFGKFLKLGCIEDSGNHKRISPLLRFFSSKSEEDLISLDEYIENMKENQTAIYYLASDSLKSAKSAPFLEKLVQKDIEVYCYHILAISSLPLLCLFLSSGLKPGEELLDNFSLRILWRIYIWLTWHSLVFYL